MDLLAPPEVAQQVSQLAAKKASTTLPRLICLGILAGAYISLAANLATIVASDAAKYLGFGLCQVISGSVFSLGLVLVLVGGAELFTGNNMVMTAGLLDGSVTWRDVLRNWVVVYFSNFAGAMLVVCLITAGFYGVTGTGMSSGLADGAVGAKALLTARAKVQYTWCAAFARGILCNWLVCLAVWLSLASKSVPGKMMGCFLPVMAFVASGFEHSVANMFFIPMGLALGKHPQIVDLAARSLLSPDQALAVAAGASEALEAVKSTLAATLTWSSFIWRNLIPVTLGNMVGGGLFVGGAYWLAYLAKGTAAAPASAGQVRTAAAKPDQARTLTP